MFATYNDPRDTDSWEEDSGFCTFCGLEFRASELSIVFQDEKACPECLAELKQQATDNNEVIN
jgi:hypothetical protein